MCEKGSTYGLVWVGDPWRVCLGCTMTFVMLLQPLFTVTVTSRRDHPEMILRLWLDTCLWALRHPFAPSLYLPPRHWNSFIAVAVPMS